MHNEYEESKKHDIPQGLLPHRITLIGKLDVKCIHRVQEGMHGRVDILKDQFLKPYSIGLGVALAVDNSHLFDKSALAGLARPCKETQSGRSYH